MTILTSTDLSRSRDADLEAEIESCDDPETLKKLCIDLRRRFLSKVVVTNLSSSIELEELRDKLNQEKALRELEVQEKMRSTFRKIESDITCSICDEVFIKVS